MATITKKVCDRCGREIEYKGWTSKIFKKPSKFKLRRINNGNPSGYDYLDGDIELCNPCTKLFDEFINKGRND